MRLGKRGQGERVRAIEITPMIDVVFLLIIFFMTTARFALETRADLELPREKGEQQETAEEAGIIINIDADGAIIVDGRRVSLDGLERIVTAEVARLPGRNAERLKLLIRADRGGNTRRLNEIVARLRATGVGAARLATQVPE
ncbi:MAG: biopolymer transporter ExbD [Planctomycetota bacterium]|nr:biopolymer transporter ExbD [Planctomycetota bacterium]